MYVYVCSFTVYLYICNHVEFTVYINVASALIQLHYFSNILYYAFMFCNIHCACFANHTVNTAYSLIIPVCTDCKTKTTLYACDIRSSQKILMYVCSITCELLDFCIIGFVFNHRKVASNQIS